MLDLEMQGFCLLPQALDGALVDSLLQACEGAFHSEGQEVRARSSRGHVYAARNLIRSVPLVRSFWRQDPLREFLTQHLGDDFGLVRVLFFDKPPDRTWGLAWHKDTAIAVRDHTLPSRQLIRPTVKAGVPHVVASDAVLQSMLTLRVHLDEVTDENGPLQVVPQSHRSGTSEGLGVSQAVTIHAARGQVLAMRPLITHGSGSSQPGTSRHRRILHLEFAADRNLPDGYEWHEFVGVQDGEFGPEGPPARP